MISDLSVVVVLTFLFEDLADELLALCFLVGLEVKSGEVVHVQ